MGLNLGEGCSPPGSIDCCGVTAKSCETAQQCDMGTTEAPTLLTGKSGELSACLLFSYIGTPPTFQGSVSVLGLPNEYHRLGGRSNRNAFSHVLEAKSLTWGVGRAELPSSKGSREWSFCFSQLLLAPGGPWFVAASLQSLPQLPLAACVPVCLVFIGHCALSVSLSSPS